MHYPLQWLNKRLATSRKRRGQRVTCYKAWRPLDPLINSARHPRRENPVSADLEHPRPLPGPEKQCKTIGQAQPYRLPFPPGCAALSVDGCVHRGELASTSLPRPMSDPGLDRTCVYFSFGFSHSTHSLPEKPGNSDGLIKAALGTPTSPPMVAGHALCHSPGCQPNLPQPVTRGRPSQHVDPQASGALIVAVSDRWAGHPRSISLMPVLTGPPQASNLGPGRRGIPD